MDERRLAASEKELAECENVLGHRKERIKELEDEIRRKVPQRPGWPTTESRLNAELEEKKTLEEWIEKLRKEFEEIQTEIEWEKKRIEELE
jgi:peptidoglycan hydrolase CwlO-like protein